MDARFLGHVQALVGQVGDDDGQGAGQPGHLGGHGAHKALAHDHGGLAQLQFGLPHGVQPGVPQVPEGGLLHVNALGGGGAVDGAHDQVLGVLAGGDHHVPHLWGNRNAALNRVTIITGDLCQMLFANRLLTGSFAQYQDQLQHVLEACPTFENLRVCLKAYYQQLLPDVYRTARAKGSQEIYWVQRYIQEHYDQDLSLKALAEVACVSPHYFSAYFKAETGQNYKAYLTQVRMEHAMRLVMATDLKAYEIAEQVGYNNVRRFVDAFRMADQMSPTDYRKLHKR